MSEATPLRRPPRVTKIDHEGEARVLELLRSGKKNQALEKLMLMYGDAVLAHLTRVTRDGEVARDLCQMTFIAAHKSLESFQEKSSLRTWLFSIAKHRAYDEMKRSRRQQVHEDFDVWKKLAVEPDSSVRGEEWAKRQALDDCLAKLPEETRQQVLLRMAEGLSYNELGVHSHEAHGTVQVRISRALKQLRKCLRLKGFSR